MTNFKLKGLLTGAALAVAGLSAAIMITGGVRLLSEKENTVFINLNKGI